MLCIRVPFFSLSLSFLFSPLLCIFMRYAIESKSLDGNERKSPVSGKSNNRSPFSPFISKFSLCSLAYLRRFLLRRITRKFENIPSLRRGTIVKRRSRSTFSRNPCSETKEWNFPRGGGKVWRGREKADEKREQMVGRSRPGLMPHGGKSPGFIKPSRLVEGRRMKKELAVKFEAVRRINIYIYIHQPAKKKKSYLLFDA